MATKQKNKRHKIMKNLYQNYPDTMILIKGLFIGVLLGAFLMFAPSEVVIPSVLIAVVVAIIALIIWSFQQERHMYDRDKPNIYINYEY